LECYLKQTVIKTDAICQEQQQQQQKNLEIYNFTIQRRSWFYSHLLVLAGRFCPYHSYLSYQEEKKHLTFRLLFAFNVVNFFLNKSNFS